MTLRMSVVGPNGIDTSGFAPNHIARGDIRKTWRGAGDECVVGMIGRLDPVMDHRNFLAAAEALLLSRPTVRFVLAGVGT